MIIALEHNRWKSLEEEEYMRDPDRENRSLAGRRFGDSAGGSSFGAGVLRGCAGVQEVGIFDWSSLKDL